MSSAIGPGRMRVTDKVKGKESPLPSAPGVYRHINKKTGAVDYAGQTNNLRKRQQEHKREGKLDTDKQKIAYSKAKTNASKNDLCNTEKAHIGRHKPPGNKYSGGNGRR